MLSFITILLALSGVQSRVVKNPKSTDSYHSASQLTIEVFNGTLKSKPYALVEFYASWCPSCRHFAPEYEKIALFFKNVSLSTGESVFVARVDCALEGSLCDYFGVEMYPSVYFGKGTDYSNSKSVKRFTGMRNPTEIVSWVARNTGERISYDENVVTSMQELKISDPEMASATPANQGDWHMDDIEKTTLMVFDTMKQASTNRRQAVYDILSIFAWSHPSVRCRRASEVLVEQFDEFWPASSMTASKEFLNYELCPGADVKVLEWRACKGSRPDTRGFTCGLWTLFHGLSVRLPNRPHIGEQFVTMLRSFVDNFFRCATCREHFLAMLQEYTTELKPVGEGVGASNGVAPSATKSQSIGKDLVRVSKFPKTRFESAILLWEMHNAVNARLAHEEAAEAKGNGGISYSGDAAYPKIQFPTADRCPRCRRKNQTVGSGSDPVALEYDKWQVFRYLERVYGVLDSYSEFEDEKMPKEKGWFGNKSLLIAIVLLGIPVVLLMIILFVGDRKTLRGIYAAAGKLNGGINGRSGKGESYGKDSEGGGSFGGSGLGVGAYSGSSSNRASGANSFYYAGTSTGGNMGNILRGMGSRPPKAPEHLK